jgi:hypothetical protein
MNPVARLAAFAALIGTLAFTNVLPASADSHLPIIDIVPTSSWGLTSDGIAPNGGPNNPPNTNGTTEINGTVALPLAKGLSISYSRNSLGVFDASLSSVTIGGNKIYPGGSRDLVQTYAVAYHINRFNIEGGFGSRYRRCCPAARTDTKGDATMWNKGFLGVSYATPSLNILNHGFFVLDVTANSSHHYNSPDALARQTPGLSLPNGKQVYTMQQAITAIIPIDSKHGVRTATTYLWGALDYFRNQPFPLYYGVFIVSATKQITPEFGITANVTNVIQRDQGAPFTQPPFDRGASVRVAALNVLADFHLDLNKIFHPATPPTTPGRPTTPGVPGGPGGPAQVGPTQGGTVSPAPAVPSPEPSKAP